MPDLIYFFAAILCSYLIGAIPFGLVFSRMKGINIQSVGSGNIGATNVFRMVSKGLGIATFAMDMVKGFVPAYGFPLLAVHGLGLNPVPWLSIACGCAAIAGHNWPVYLKFRGGKGVATSTGVLLGIAPTAAAIGLASWILLFITSRYVSVASMGAALIVAAAGWVLHARSGLLIPLTLAVLAMIVVWRHRSNLQRLAQGTEHRFNFKRTPKEDMSNEDQPS